MKLKPVHPGGAADAEFDTGAGHILPAGLWSAIIPKGAEEIPEFGDLPKSSVLINKLSKLK